MTRARPRRCQGLLRNAAYSDQPAFIFRVDAGFRCGNAGSGRGFSPAGRGATRERTRAREDGEHDGNERLESA